MVLVDETEYPVNTFGVVALLAWLIPRVYIDWSRALLAVRKNHKKNGGADDGGELEHQLGRVQMHAFLGIATWSTIMIVASCLCAKYSVGMDSRMVLILGGFSRIVTAAVSFFVSLELPQWLGVYDYISIILDNEKAKDTTNRNRRTSTTPTLTTTTPAFSLRVTLFELQWAIMGEYARVFWIVQVFSCGNDPSWGLPVSYSVGLVLGIFVTYGVYFGRTRLSPKRRIQTTYFCMLFLSVMACVLFGYGALFIQDVWNPDQSIRHVRTVSAVTCLVAAAIAAGCHFVAYKIAKRKAIDKQARLEAGEKIPESRFHSELFAPRTVSSAVHRAANAIGSIPRGGLGGSVNKKDDEDANNDVEENKERSEQNIDDVEGNSPTGEVTGSTATNGEHVGDAGEEGPTLPDKEEEEDDVCDVCSDWFEPALSSLCLSRMRCCTCCCAPCGWSERGMFSKLNTKGKAFMSLKWLLRFLLQGLCIYMTIVNIGATQQGNTSKELFDSVHAILYDGQEKGPVCAYQESFSDELTQTLENAQAAYDANYTIAHCGACAACSTWQNLELQWTTRNNLAILSKQCAKKLIFGGYEKSLQCHLDTIGFDIPCSDCWVEVEQCAIEKCAYIQMQAWIINNLGNFEVGPDMVTAAMCEEANCEVYFVPCSGANRRRMNIVSDIARPGTQQCPLVPDGNVKWLGLFGPEDPPI